MIYQTDRSALPQVDDAEYLVKMVTTTGSYYYVIANYARSSFLVSEFQSIYDIQVTILDWTYIVGWKRLD